jgi:hypothetical protein
MLSYRHSDLLDSLSKSFRVGDRVRPSDSYKDYLVGGGWKQDDVDQLVGSILNTVCDLGPDFIEVLWDGDQTVDKIEKARIVKL